MRDILREFGFPAHIRPRGEEATTIKSEAGGLRAALDGGTEPFVDSALSPEAFALGQKAGKLSSLSSFFLWLDRESSREVIRIGSYPEATAVKAFICDDLVRMRGQHVTVP